jgi:pimeloyl-ACP methyl ester carboxylesterase
VGRLGTTSTGVRALGCAAMARTYHPPGLVLAEHEFGVPLDHGAPDGERITVFAREVADPDGRDRPFLVFFRADAIVRDAEWIRRELGVERWSILGQSFGGLCALTYWRPRASARRSSPADCPPWGTPSTRSIARRTPVWRSAAAASTSATPRIAGGCARSWRGSRATTCGCLRAIASAPAASAGWAGCWA